MNVHWASPMRHCFPHATSSTAPQSVAAARAAHATTAATTPAQGNPLAPLRRPSTPRVGGQGWGGERTVHAVPRGASHPVEHGPQPLPSRQWPWGGEGVAGCLMGGLESSGETPARQGPPV
eukprot:COSAG04_NODE_1861_length_5373_cov_2.087410_2_plen_121_part_00